MLRLVPARLLEVLLGVVAYGVWYACVALHCVLRPLGRWLWPTPRSPYAGKTVLVTTGRQAKTLHSIRALKELGCRVIVTDYQEMSCSAVSTACDASAVLAPLDSNAVHCWVDRLETLIRQEKVDLVIPMSTINEALFIGVAKDWLAKRLPHVEFCCEGLALMSRLDNKPQFSAMCEQSGVPVPESGVVTSRAEMESGGVPFGEMDVILKRVESSINREEEIKIVPRGSAPPASVQPTSGDPWQWQRFIRGREYSAWFVAVKGKITFQGCYVSADDLLFFDGEPVPSDVEEAIARFIAKYKLTGQYAFDFFREDGTDKFYVIECNPRSSSVLEGVSSTPGWGASFFGEDMRAATQYQNVGFWFHRNSWPFAAGRAEGFWSLRDPLPFFIAECAWPLEMLRIKGALKGGALARKPTGIPIGAGTPLTALAPALFEALGLNYHHLDVNIGKIIVPGATPGRGYAIFEEMEGDMRAAFVRGQAQMCGPAPRILCTDACVAEALDSVRGCEPQITQVVADPSEARRSAGRRGVSIILGSPADTLHKLAQQKKAFDVVFLSGQDLADIPEGLLALGGRAVATETLPEATNKKLA